MYICDFRIVVCGPAEDRGMLADLMRALPQQDSPGHLYPVVFLDDLLSDVSFAQDHSRQTWFWIPSGFIFEEDDLLLIRGSMKDSPPLLLMLELFRQFPALSFDCYSVTENEHHEHWRVGPGIEECELIEEKIIDAKSGKCLKFFVKGHSDIHPIQSRPPKGLL